jgi:hypothetical protein
MHTRVTTGASRQSPARKRIERVRRIQVVVSDAVRMPTRHLRTASWWSWSIHLVLVLKTWRREVAHGVRLGTSHLGKWDYRRRRHVWVRRRVTTEWSVWVLCFLSTALRACVVLCLSSLDIPFTLELRNEFLNDVDFEVMENIYKSESVNAPNSNTGQHTRNSFLRCEHSAELFNKVTAVFLIVLDSDANREFLRVHNFANRSFETTNIIVSHSQSANLNLLAHAIHTNTKGHG